MELDRGKTMKGAEIQYNFWESWDNLSQIEQDGISKVIRARDLIRSALPTTDLVAIYIKGSFVRREMRPGSDIDIVPIVTKTALERQIFATNVPEVAPACIVPLSLEEFQANKLMTVSDFQPDLRAEPDLFLKELENYAIIYGTPLNPGSFPMRSDEQIVRDEIVKIRDGYLKAYESGANSNPPIKELFWLVEFLQRSKGIKVVHSFQGILESVQDPDHIVHRAYQLKLRGDEVTRGEWTEYAQELKQYLASFAESS